MKAILHYFNMRSQTKLEYEQCALKTIKNHFILFSFLFGLYLKDTHFTWCKIYVMIYAQTPTEYYIIIIIIKYNFCRKIFMSHSSSAKFFLIKKNIWTSYCKFKIYTCEHLRMYLNKVDSEFQSSSPQKFLHVAILVRYNQCLCI